MERRTELGQRTASDYRGERLAPGKHQYAPCEEALHEESDDALRWESRMRNRDLEHTPSALTVIVGS